MRLGAPTYLATDEGLSIFCCGFTFDCSRKDLLLGLVTLCVRSFFWNERNMILQSTGD